jgi:hypothetical protein
LQEHVTAWEDLASDSIEPNPFFEHWMMIPAMKLVAGDSDLRVVLLYAPEPQRPRRRYLCGVFPLERTKGHKGLPISSLSLWRHRYCFLSVPLIRQGYADVCIRSFLDWLKDFDHGCALMEFQRIPGDGPFNSALISALYDRNSLTFAAEAYVRAVLQPKIGAEAYIRAAISAEHRKDIRRRGRRLAETGRLEYRELDSPADVDYWIDQFLSLEVEGWKGDDGGAFACREADRKFFVEIAKEAFRRNRLMMIALEFDGRPISYKCNILAGEGSFAFKIAYDEQFSRYSPGLMLELNNIERVHAREDLEWMDSCACPDHPMIDRIWMDRKVIQNLVVPTGRHAGGFWVSALPLLRWFSRQVKAILSLNHRSTSQEIQETDR